jgi:hypothetical protein
VIDLAMVGAPGLEPGPADLRDTLLTLIFQKNFPNGAKIPPLEINRLQRKIQP